MKKIIAVLLSVILMTALAGCAGKSVRKADEVIDVAKLPAKFDLRNVDGQNYVTPVKCQSWGDCWSFALAGAAETAYLYANGLGVSAGEKTDKVNFSEKYTVWYMFHGFTKDDVARARCALPRSAKALI